ncbi:MAG: hypothetical protein ACXVB9_16445 [Bdellovibrionota bacterium]
MLLETIQDSVQAAQTLRSEDVSSLCRETTRELLDGMSTRDEKALVEKSTDPWFDSMHPNAQIRLSGFLNHAELKKAGLNSFGAAETYLRNPYPITISRDGYPFVSLDEIENSDGTYDDAKKSLSSNFVFQAACNSLVLGTGCGKALKEGVELGTPVEGNYTYFPLYREILTNKKYDEGLKVAALKIMSRIKDSDLEGADFFSDLQSSFQSTGISQEEAREMAWKTLGLIATAGPNIAWRIFRLTPQNDDMPKKVALSIISSLASVLDSMTFKSGHPYSYPKSIHTTCDSGKTYHFWLSAYLAHDLVQRGHKPIDAAAAAFTAQKGYEMLATGSGRKPSRPFTEDFVSPNSDMIRMDLAYSSAGALYGAQGKAELPLDVDQGLRQIFRDGKPTAKMSERDADALAASAGPRYFLRWRSLFSPDSAFHYYRKMAPGSP